MINDHFSLQSLAKSSFFDYTLLKLNFFRLGSFPGVLDAVQSHLRFTQMLPRPVAGLIMRWALRQTTMTKRPASYWCWIKLAREFVQYLQQTYLSIIVAGFATFEVYITILAFLVSTNCNAPMKFALKPKEDLPPFCRWAATMKREGPTLVLTENVTERVLKLGSVPTKYDAGVHPMQGNRL